MRKSTSAPKSKSHPLRRALAAMLACCVLCAPSISFASHYYLEDIELVSGDARTKLIEHGIETTEQLLERMVSQDERDDLALMTGLTADEVNALAKTIELMQVRGIGPKAAALLISAGVGSVAELAKADAEALLAKTIEANAEHAHTGTDPTLEIIQGWVKLAAEAPIHITK